MRSERTYPSVEFKVFNRSSSGISVKFGRWYHHMDMHMWMTLGKFDIQFHFFFVNCLAIPNMIPVIFNPRLLHVSLAKIAVHLDVDPLEFCPFQDPEFPVQLDSLVQDRAKTAIFGTSGNFSKRDVRSVVTSFFSPVLSVGSVRRARESFA